MADDFVDDEVNPDTLEIVRFKENLAVKTFDCGNRDLNDFLCTAEVAKYEAENLGKTYLVYFRGQLVAYFTISWDGLRIEYLQSVKSFSRFGEMKVETIPAIKIGRLATDRRWKGKGIGRHLVRYIAGMALESQGAARLLILQAKPESIEFYQKLGFDFVTETKRERGRLNKTMFLDLQDIA